MLKKQHERSKSLADEAKRDVARALDRHYKVSMARQKAKSEIQNAESELENAKSRIRKASAKFQKAQALEDKLERKADLLARQRKEHTRMAESLRKKMLSASEQLKRAKRR